MISPSNWGILEWGGIFLAILVIFGPKSLPKIGRMIGKGIRELRSATKGITDSFDLDEDDTTAKAPPAQTAQTSEKPDESDARPDTDSQTDSK